MNKHTIIQKAAKKSGMPLPLDKKTQELSEGLLNSLEDGIKWANDKPNNLIKTDVKKWLEDLQRKADKI
jgi:ABC-type nitrate/sulfonate/bicarbonate transport system substrate-binding protein